jgi:putative ABC transport system ATP-binding protein
VASVVVKDVSKVYDADGAAPVRALHDVTLSVDSGEMVALVGPSGCGKSTLLNLVGCIDVPTAGTVSIDGAVTTRLDDDALTALRRVRIGTVFQFFNLLPALSVADNVAVPLVLARRPRDEIRTRVAAALEAVGISEKAHAFPRQLSGGQAQRVAVARATVHKPAILLADEPTGNLDSGNANAVLGLLVKIAASGQAILVATHSADVAAVCTRCVRMQDGMVVE